MNLTNGIELAARFVEKRRDDYVQEHGSYDPSTGMTEFPGSGEEYVGELEEIIEGIRALTAPARAAEPVKPYDNDAVWARFYRDGKTLGEICEEFNVGIYSLSPWLTAPLVRAATQATDVTIDT